MSENAKPRFNVIDLVIILAVLAVVVTVVLRSGVTDQLSSRESTDTVEITFVSIGIKKSEADAFQVGDTVYCSSNGMKLGTVTYCEVTPYEYFVENDAGELVKVSSDIKVTLRGTVTCTGIMTDEGFMLGGTQYLAAGSTFAFHNQIMGTNLSVLSVRVAQ